MRKPKFKYDDVRTAATIFEKGDYFFSFDLKSAYHHIEIEPDYHKYFGFSWKNEDNQVVFYVFTCLPFGLCTAPYVFTKVCRVLVRHWRSQGFKTLMFLDDGAGSANSMRSSRAIALAVRNDVLNSGFY